MENGIGRYPGKVCPIRRTRDSEIMSDFMNRLKRLAADHKQLLNRPNPRVAGGNGQYDRHEHPVLTSGHAPLHWRYDLNPEINLQDGFIDTGAGGG